MLFLGFDGGGTKCTGVAVDVVGALLAEATGPSTNQNSVGWEAAEASFAGVVRALAAKLGPLRGRCGGVCMGMSGTDRVEGRERWEAAARRELELEGEGEGPAATVTVVNDAVTALASGTRGKLEGVVVISGTGTIALGRGLGGQQTRCQGWGPLLGDVGSGYDVGLLVLKAVMRAHDGMGPATLMTDQVLAATGARAPDELVPWAYAGAKEWQRYAALAPIAEKCAESGDEAALRVIDATVQGLWDAVRGVVAKTALPEKWTLVLAGGNLARGLDAPESVYSRMLKDRVLKEWGGARVSVVHPVVSAAEAAALIALQGRAANNN